MTGPDRSLSPARRRRIVLLVLSLLGTLIVLALALDIARKKREANPAPRPPLELVGEVDDPEAWGHSFPQQLADYRATVDQARTRFGGSDALPRTPTPADPRSTVAQSKLEADPRLLRMWAGYAFAIDHREERGHAFMLDDQTFTARHRKTQPGACLQCHASIVSTNRRLGEGAPDPDAAGAAKLNAMPYAEARTHVDRAIGCIDCHDPATLRLRVSRPAFIEAIARLEASRGRPGYDVNAMAPRAQMRTFVCAQCHTEYALEDDGARLVHAWESGPRADEILARYDATGFRDWVHAETGAPMLKAQHPEFELWSQGIHARAEVSCVDCHMPYRRVGATKITDHHVRSPLLDTARACQVCHPIAADELVARAEAIQERTLAMQDAAMNRLIELIDALAAAQENDPDDPRLEAARSAQRRASFLLDFVSSENSAGFHAPQEAARLLFLALDEILAGSRALASGEADATGPAAASPR
jgi:nitrite reductase (cytochrome c-552)